MPERDLDKENGAPGRFDWANDTPPGKADKIIAPAIIFVLLLIFIVGTILVNREQSRVQTDPVEQTK